MRTTTDFWSDRSVQSSGQLTPLTPSKPSGIRQGFNQLVQGLLNNLSGSDEPRITEKRNRGGGSQWQVYDPTTGQSTTFLSEAEVRAWLDQRYHT